jgi:drug/metabolite transporter (DMT)-like permease
MPVMLDVWPAFLWNEPMQMQTRGIMVATIGVLILSFDALLVRLADSPATTVVFWRGFCLAIAVSALMLVTGRFHQWRQWFLAGPLAWCVTVLYGLCMTLFVASIHHTSVANTVVILASSSLFAALFSIWLMGERLSRATWLAIASAFAGVLLVFGGSITLNSAQWLGDVLALALAMVMGLSLTLMRKQPELPRLPMVAGSGAVAAGLMTLLASMGWVGSPLEVSSTGLGWLALMGLVQIPIASILLMQATKFLPAAEVSLFLLLETILGPVWVYWVLNEAVSDTTLLGGSVVLLTLALHSGWSLSRNHYERAST